MPMRCNGECESRSAAEEVTDSNLYGKPSILYCTVSQLIYCAMAGFSTAPMKVTWTIRGRRDAFRDKIVVIDISEKPGS